MVTQVTRTHAELPIGVLAGGRMSKMRHIPIPYEAKCVVKYSTWPKTGTAVTNEMGNTTYNGVTADNDYSLRYTGATSFVLNDANDYIKVPKGALVNNLGAHTFEFIFTYNTTSAFTSRFMDKMSQYLMYIDTTNRYLSIKRMDDGGVAYRGWHTPNSTFVAGHNYFLQISWDATSFSSDPLIKINNATQTLTTAHSGVTDVWQNEAADDMYLFNDATVDRILYSTVYLVRIHNAALTDAQLNNNYLADYWRYGWV